MGCEGYISTARVIDGHERINDKLPAFKVTEPVAIVPLYREVLGSAETAHRWVNLSSYHTLFDRRLANPGPQRWQLVIFGDNGVVVIPRSDVTVWLEDKFVGGIHTETQEKHWDKLTGGLWIITHYHTAGWEENDYWSLLPQNHAGIILDDPVEWMIWT